MLAAAAVVSSTGAADPSTRTLKTRADGGPDWTWRYAARLPSGVSAKTEIELDAGSCVSWTGAAEPSIGALKS